MRRSITIVCAFASGSAGLVSGCASDAVSAAASEREPARLPLARPPIEGDLVERAAFDVPGAASAVLDDLLEEGLPRNLVHDVAVVGDTTIVRTTYVVYELRPNSAGCRVRMLVSPKLTPQMPSELLLERTAREGYHEEIGFLGEATPPRTIGVAAEKEAVVRAAALALIRDGHLIRNCEERSGIVGDLSPYCPKVWVRERDGRSEARIYAPTAATRRKLAAAILREIEGSSRSTEGG